MNTRKWLALAALMMFLPLGCGNEQTADAGADAAPVLDAVTVADRLVQNLHDQATVFEAIGDELEAVEDQAAADELGRRLAGEYSERIIAQLEDMAVWVEAHVMPVDAAERATFDQELEALLTESGRMEEAERRFDRATEQWGGQLETLMMRNPGQGQAVLEGMVALFDQMEAFLQGERVRKKGTPMIS